MLLGVFGLISYLEVKVLIPILKVIQYVAVIVSTVLFGCHLYPPQAQIFNNQSFDFIVVGAGSAGCVLANRLTEVANWTVLLIEAGDDPPSISESPGWSSLIGNALPDWGYYSVNDRFSSQARKTKNIQVTKGKMLGGSSALNYMFYVRGNKADYDSWVDEGNPGWDWSNVSYYFKKSERLEDDEIMKKSAPLRSQNGYLGVNVYPWKERTMKYFDLFKENGHQILVDTNGHQQLGYSPPQYTIDDGIRQSAAVSFLRPIKDRPNLFVLKNTLVTKVIFENKKAIGVELILPHKNVITALTNKEVILSAGAINSPKLLMLSGVGPKEHLKDMDIKLILESQHVGQNLQDHIIVPVLIAEGKDKSSMLHNTDVFKNLDKFPLAAMMGFVAVNKHQKYPDYQVTVCPLPIGNLISTFYCDTLLNLEDSICINLARISKQRQTVFALLTFLHPKSKGEIKLKNKNPEENPQIFAKYYSDESDLEVFSNCVEDYLTILNTSYFRSLDSNVVDLGVEQCQDFEFASHEYWKCYILNVAGTQFHQSGTCRMGRKGEGVLDERLKVRDVGGLRVVDASVMPAITSGNINAPVIMIAEKASDIIKLDYGIDPGAVSDGT